MSQCTIVLDVDGAYTADDASAERLLRRISARVAPQLQRQVGAITYRDGEASRTAWTTEGWLDDGSFSTLSIDVGAAKVKLFIDTAPALKPPPQPWRAPLKLAFAVVITGFAVAGWGRFRSVGSILGGLVAGVVAWTTVEILWTARRERLRQRIAAARPIDEAAWRTRLLEAIASPDSSS